jgi:type I restriction enzyme S subunit
VFLFLWMQSPGFHEQVQAVAGQTDMAPYVSLRDQRRMSVLLTAAEEQAKLSKQAGPILDLAAQNVAQNQSLAALHDLLMPKLILGEIWLKNAEQAVRGAV